jgi:hypothetical protein
MSVVKTERKNGMTELTPETPQVQTAPSAWEEFVSIGLDAREQKDVAQRVLGELAHKVEKQYGYDSMGKYAYEIGINKLTLYRYRDVFRGYIGKTWYPQLSYTHHLIALGSADPDAILQKAMADNWSSERLALEVKAEKTGEEPPKAPKLPNPEYCPKCNAWKVDHICSCRILS